MSKGELAVRESQALEDSHVIRLKCFNRVIILPVMVSIEGYWALLNRMHAVFHLIFTMVL